MPNAMETRAALAEYEPTAETSRSTRQPSFPMSRGSCGALIVRREKRRTAGARVVNACAAIALGGIAGELSLNRIPERLVDDRLVFARMGLSLVDDLAVVRFPNIRYTALFENG